MGRQIEAEQYRRLTKEDNPPSQSTETPGTTRSVENVAPDQSKEPISVAQLVS
ncbi:hypothetical protein DPMN_045819 [Dreissena polymorpha]|uniref:Uncharacterized protein n=1 Tax=Dreissena polymorpha TaxID=45954 RepID=A0A9D4D5L8_DREPO|nr:hypothetical protein DPMN_045819 [Dreissena polymorpha]